MNENSKFHEQNMLPHKVDYAEYLLYVDDAKQNETAEDFLGDYGYPPNCPYDAETLIIWAQIIFAVAHNDWRKLVDVAGEKFSGLKTATAFARFFEIPHQSLQHWLHDRREPPVYIIQLVGFALASDLPLNGLETVIDFPGEDNQNGDV